ncbi:Lactose permease [Klebsiella pneumoniae]|nr:Lactose permease [Klebsiella pneumoniae]
MSLRIIGSAWAIGPVSISLIKLLHGFESSVLLVAALKYITANFNPLLSATVYLIGFQFSKSFSSIFLSTGIGHIYQSMGFTISHNRCPRINVGGSVYVSFILWRGVLR